MKICKKEKVVKEYKHPPLIKGNIYKRADKDTGDIYICAYANRLVCLADGIGFDGLAGFAEYDIKWVDVTDKYCLMEI